MSGIRIFNAAVQQLQTSQSNLSKIGTARAKAEQDKKEFDIKIKRDKEDLETAVLKGQMTRIDAQVQKSLFDATQKTNNKIFEGKAAQTDQTEYQQVQTMKQADKVSKDILRTDPETQQAVSQVLVQGYPPGILGEIETGFSGGRATFKKKSYGPKTPQDRNRIIKLADIKARQASGNRKRLPTQEESAKYIKSATKALYPRISEEEQNDIFNSMTSDLDQDNNNIPMSQGEIASIGIGLGTEGIGLDTLKGAGETKQFRDNETGELVTFKKVDGKWVKAQ